MNATELKARQTENLKKAMALDRISKSQDYLDVLKPYLEKLGQVPYINPTEFKDEKEFLHALKSANARAGAYGELLRFLSQQDVIINRIRQDMEKTPKSYGV